MTSGKIIDVGTGPGYLPFEIAKRSQSLEIIGIDISSKMVEIANKNAENFGLSERVKFQIGDVANLPFEDKSFEFVVSTLSFHHWSKPRESLNETHLVLKENGEAWIYGAREDTTKEVNEEFRKQYGWFLSFLFLHIVRAHSSVKLKEVEEIL